MFRLKSMFDRQIRGPGGAGELVAIAVPLIATYASEMVMMFTDRLFLSRLSGAHMAAAMGGGLATFTATTFFLGIHGYSNAMVAQRLGAGEKSRCPVVTAQALIIALLAYPLMIACIPLGFRIFRIAGIAGEHLLQQRTYFAITMVGTILPLLRSGLGNFFSGIGRTRINMIAALTSMVLNVGLNYILIFGKFGFPALGIAGAAIGTMIAGAAGLLVLVFAYIRPALVHEFSILKSFRLDKKLMTELLRLGYPAGLEMLLNLVAFNTLVAAFHSRGEAVATAITITFSWDMVSFIPMTGLSIAVTSLAGRYCGAGAIPAVYRSAASGLKLAATYSVLLLVPYLFFTGALVNVFLPPDKAELEGVRELSLFMVRLISVYLLCDAMLQVFGGALRGAGDTFWSMAASVGMHWTFACITQLMLRVFAIDPKTTWIAVIVAFFFYGPLYLVRFRSGKWERRARRIGVGGGSQ